MTNTKGYTLLELLIAMALSLAVLVPVLQTLAQSRRTYDFQRELSVLQDNGRFAVDFLGTRLRESGWGGATGQLSDGVEGCDGNNCTFARDVRIGGAFEGLNIGDVIQVRYNSDPSSPIDCFGAAGNNVINTFFVAPDAGIPSLFCLSSVGDGVARPLLPDVQNMQITYGVNNGAGIQYVTANAANMPQVTVVRISLLMRAARPTRISIDTRNYVLEGVPFTFQGDANQNRFMRRVYNLTMTLRNRVL